MKYLDDQILAEAYSKILESSPDTTREYGENEIDQGQDEFERDSDIDNSHPELSVAGYHEKLTPEKLLDNCQRYINELKEMVKDMNHNDLEEEYYMFFQKASLLQEHATALNKYAAKLRRGRMRR